MFELENLHSYYGKSHIVQGVSLSVGDGEAVGLIGRNGVGKTTTLKSVMGLLSKTEGRMLLDGVDVCSKPTHIRAQLGIGYVPEERAVFPAMSVEENIRIGTLLHSGDQSKSLETAYSLFPILAERRRQLAGTLSGGQQKMLGLARGLALGPKLLLVDEPSEGLMPINVELIARGIETATRQGISVLVVDASFDLLRIACSRLYVMDRGVLVGAHRPSDFSSPDELAASYLAARA
jgi:ABC-type branched-subunit amino acid transport system ATPase component